jgi:hypothetical protein
MRELICLAWQQALFENGAQSVTLARTLTSADESAGRIRDVVKDTGLEPLIPGLLTGKVQPWCRKLKDRTELVDQFRKAVPLLQL